MELTKKFKANLVGKAVEVKAVYVTDSVTGKGYYIVPSGEILRLIGEETGYNLKGFDVRHVTDKIAIVTASDETENITGVGSCAITPDTTIDPVGIAMRRAILNFAFMTCAFDDVYDKLRALNGQTLDLATSDRLNQSLEKLF
jgi:hypothetical protein